MPETLERPRTAAAAGPERAGREERPLLLLIDDEPCVGRFLAHAAEECGYRALATVTAGTASGANIVC